jgi:hypothetical protein
VGTPGPSAAALLKAPSAGANSGCEPQDTVEIVSVGRAGRLHALPARPERVARDPLHIGQASDLATRLGAGLGMNEVLVHLRADTESERLAIETRLRHLNPTPLNRQGGGLGLGAPPSLLGLGGLLRDRNPGLGGWRAHLKAPSRSPRCDPFGE